MNDGNRMKLLYSLMSSPLEQLYYSVDLTDTNAKAKNIVSLFDRNNY